VTARKPHPPAIEHDALTSVPHSFRNWRQDKHEVSQVNSHYFCN
jgi:hypothetical protein